ncbi:MAG: CdaR family protein [Trueperaceae bacterium]|nr:CdaR family protein [Trueperaceae bacterium]
MTWRRILRRLRRDWPGKLAAIAAALVLWWVASTNPDTTAQRSLLVPLQVTGAAEDEVTVGVPARVEVVVTGGSERMERLSARDIEAVLDLSGASGEFSRRIEARAPTALRVERVVPDEVIGRLEAMRRAEFLVRPRVEPAPAGEVFATVHVTPERAVVEARDPVLADVDGVVAWRPGDAPTGGEAVLLAVDAGGRPVAETHVVPEVATLEVVREPRWARSLVAVSVTPPSDPRVRIEGVTPGEVELIGPVGAADEVETVDGRVPDATAMLPPGRYDLPVRLALPDGVVAAGSVTAQVRVSPDVAPPGVMRGP